MNAISLMVEEHKNIKRVLKVIRKLCVKILNGETVNYKAFNMIVDFVRNYADSHHHSKEEDILFKKMSEELGEEIAKGPIYGMFADHDMGRLYIRKLVEALDKVKKGDEDSKVDVIANAISYTDLLYRHIDKEDNGWIGNAEKWKPLDKAPVQQESLLIRLMLWMPSVIV